MIELGVDGVRERIRTIGLFNSKARNLVRACGDPRGTPRRGGPPDALRPRGAPRGRTQDRERRAQHRVRGGDDRGGYPHLPGLQPDRARAGPKRPGGRGSGWWRTSPPSTAATPTTGSSCTGAIPAPRADRAARSAGWPISAPAPDSEPSSGPRAGSASEIQRAPLTNFFARYRGILAPSRRKSVRYSRWGASVSSARPTLPPRTAKPAPKGWGAGSAAGPTVPGHELPRGVAGPRQVPSGADCTIRGRRGPLPGRRAKAPARGGPF